MAASSRRSVDLFRIDIAHAAGSAQGRHRVGGRENAPAGDCTGAALLPWSAASKPIFSEYADIMNELFNRIASSAETDEDTARQSVGYILAFLREESSDPAVETMIAETPGTDEALGSIGEVDFGGGGLMALGAKLMGLGLDMGQIRKVAEELIAYSKSTAGEDTVEQAISSVPALAQFV
jgi:hypothetical protein